MNRQPILRNFNEPIPLVEPGGGPHGMDGSEPEVFYAGIAAMPNDHIHQPLRYTPLLPPVGGMYEHFSDDAMRCPDAMPCAAPMPGAGPMSIRPMVPTSC
jgi:hypothetical protein